MTPTLIRNFYLLLTFSIIAIYGQDETESKTTPGVTSPIPASAVKVRMLTPDDLLKPNDTHKATIFFLHGQGNSGRWIKDWIEIIEGSVPSFPHIKIVFPTAPMRTYTYFDNEARNIWFNRDNKTCNETEDIASMQISIDGLTEMIQNEVKSGIPLDKIVIGGYASGGQMAFHMAFRILPEVAGVFGINSFLPSNSIVFQHLREKKLKKLPQTYISVGEGDEDYKKSVAFWCLETLRELTQLGVSGEFGTFGRSNGLICKDILKDLWRWFQTILP